LRINYAMKALSNVAILQLLREMGSGLDTVSIQETGLHAGYAPEKNILYPKRSISRRNRREVNAMGSQINIDNLSIEQFGKKSRCSCMHPYQPTRNGRWKH
jgi:diaminopimelate decarboxylase